ncbi:hypothetical protein JG688_00002125 [Phytophthora aleatoria]|uniref:Anoctamin transmembrane domain-containing protein n=1 Tax=Phytophthora aleatoria TaxID=2496075 RepID=A0A8J5IWX7_9STRA|nr:hypothetical protein JG688_00002125 [Phytophthora aleatoria]
MVNKRTKNRRRASMMSHNLQSTANPPRRHSASSTTKTSEVSSAELVVENSHLLPTCPRRANDRDVTAMEEGGLKDGKKKLFMMSPRLDAQLGGYPPDCGTKELKYLSFAKVLRDRGMTHPMRYSSTRVDALGFALPERYPLFSTDFGAHSFHHLPTDSVVLSQYGLGIALYFKYLKVMTWLFFLLVVISAPAIAVYIVGGGTSMAELTALARQDLPSVLGITSIGHLSEASSVCDQTLENTELSLTCSAGEIGFVKARREFLGLAVGCDIACSLAFFMVVIWLRRKEKEAVDHIAQNQIKALDYTVQLVNLPHHDDLNLLRQEIVALITLSVLFLSFVFIFVAKEQKNELNKVSELVPYKALVECYCKNFLVDHSFRSMMYESFYNPETGEDELLCRSWATTFVTTQILSIASVLLVVAVNLILARILNALVALEKHHTESSLVVSRVTKVFLAQFCNTALLMLVINANANYFSSSPTVSETGTTTGGFSLGVLQVLNGEYSDFSADWYNDVGVALMLTMILNSFSTHAYLLANYIMLKARRFVDRGYSFDHSLTKQDTQRDLEALYRGPKFDLAARYAQSLTSIFITYMFSAGMPLLHFIGFGAMFMTYWADKFTFLRIARSPPLYDSKLATAAGSLLPYAVLMHCLIAMWMFSNDRIFESESGERTVNSTYSPGDGIPLFDAARGQLISRVTRPQVVVLFAFFVAGCTIVIMRSVLFEYVPALIRSVFPGLARLLEKPRIAKGIPNYFDAIPTSCLQEKLSATSGTQQLLRPDLRAKYERALLNRIAQEEDVPKMRSKRSISDIERFNQANRIIGCPSYAISDNKEYVAKLAIDSHLSEQIPLDQIF